MKSSAAIRQEDLSGFSGLVRTAPDETQKLSLLIGGTYCAACIQKIETTLRCHDGVTVARLNFSTGRLNVEWKGPSEDADVFARAIADLGYSVKPFNADAEKLAEESENRFLLLCLGVSGFAMGNIMLLSVGLWTTSTETMGAATRELMHWVSAMIAVPAVVYSGRPFFRSAFAALKNGHTNMDVPISVALILATIMSIFVTARGGEHAYFDSVVMLMFFLLIGRTLDFRARRTARRAATDLLQTLSGFANVFENGKIQKILIRDLRAGMVVCVAAGENIPVDGLVLSGQSTIDTSLVTGETLPRAITPGALVYAGTSNISAPLRLEVSKQAEDSLLADIVRLMEKAEQAQAKYVRIADRAARAYTPVVHVLAGLAVAMWWFVLGAHWEQALMIAVTVLIITCPCALGLAVPVVQVLASGLLMKRRVLVKSGDALERLARIDTVLLDKTGTLTLGKPQLIGTYSERDLRIAASLARHSRHPLSMAIAEAYTGPEFLIESVEEHPGKGLQGRYNGRAVRLGSREWCNAVSADEQESIELWLALEGQEPISFLFEDQLRPDAAFVIQALNKKHLRTILLSGDRQIVAQKIAQACGIEEVHGDLTPVQKFEYLMQLKELGHTVLMVGDGLNDAPALVGADISMAPGTAIDMAQNAADIVFMGQDLAPITIAHDIAMQSQKLVKQNFAIAILYNVIAIPLAFCGFVNPLVAALAMSGSSILVIANSFRLRWAA
jgi:Cu2+-exporting ATPase